jgi:hypothetical protein
VGSSGLGGGVRSIGLSLLLLLLGEGRDGVACDGWRCSVARYDAMLDGLVLRRGGEAGKLVCIKLWLGYAGTGVLGQCMDWTEGTLQVQRLLCTFYSEIIYLRLITC